MTDPYSPPSPAPTDDHEWAADTLDDHWATADGAEDLHARGTHLLDLVAAVDHLSRGLRHDFTVWDALDEALHWWLADHPAPGVGSTAPAEDDPLHAHMTRVLDLVARDPDTTLADALHQALRRWTTTTAAHFNAGYHWPHPTPRRAFPPPLVQPGPD